MSADDFITVVTGLPRSGTSMMMQMLAAGGLSPMTDGQRTADEDNPRGYFEYDKTKSLRSDNTWLAEAKGKAIKVIAQLLEFLPQENYRLILMQRDLSEVLISQRMMLKRSGKQGAKLSDAQLENAFSKQLLNVDRILVARNLPLLRVSYRSCIESPRAAAVEVNQLLGGGLDERAMVEAIDATLYRRKSDSATPGS